MCLVDWSIRLKNGVGQEGEEKTEHKILMGRMAAFGGVSPASGKEIWDQDSRLGKRLEPVRSVEGQMACPRLHF